MNHKIFIIALLFCCGLISACSKSAADSTASAAGEQVSRTVATSGKQPIPVWETKEVKEGPYGTKIVLTRDESGNYIETRNFENHQLIDRFVITTLVDKSKVGFCYSKNGEKIPLTDSQIALALSGSGDDLAQSVGLVKPEEPLADQPTLIANSNEVNPMPAPVITDPLPAVPAEPKPAQIADREKPDRERLKRLEDERIKRLQQEITILSSAVPRRN